MSDIQKDTVVDGSVRGPIESESVNIQKSTSFVEDNGDVSDTGNNVEIPSKDVDIPIVKQLVDEHIQDIVDNTVQDVVVPTGKGVTITYKNLNCSTMVPVRGNDYQTFISPLVNIAKAIGTCGKSAVKRQFHRLKDLEGVIRPGTMTLILAPPGHGKSTFLRAMSHSIQVDEGSEIKYNGYTYQEGLQRNSDFRKMSRFVEQTDVLLASPSVEETLKFAQQASTGEFDQKYLDFVLSLTGLTECRDVPIGSAMVAGVSGGQRRRVSVAEALVAQPLVYCLDEPTNGLDAAVAESIFVHLKKHIKETNGTLITALQQPTPGLLSSFDDVILLQSGRVAYHGSVENIVPFLTAAGFEPPKDVDMCDFIVSTLISKASYNLPEFFKTYQPLDLSLHSVQKDLVVEKRFTPSLPNGVGVALKLVLFRQLGLIYRKEVVIPRFMNDIFQSFLYGTLYSNIAEGSLQLRMAVMLITLAQIAFANMVELPVSVQFARVVKKEISCQLYPSWTYVLSSFITGIPTIIVECLIFGLFMYWLPGHNPDAGNFFIFLSIIFVNALAMTNWFKMLASIAPDEARAQAMAGPSNGIFMIFGGFFVNRASMPDWMVWMYWISPFSWSLRSLANNEFLSERYTALGPNGDVSIGKYALTILDVQAGKEWIGYGILYVFGFCLLTLLIQSVTIRTRYFEASLGTKIIEEEEPIVEEVELLNVTALPIVELGDDSFEDEKSREQSIREKAIDNAGMLKTLREAVPFQPTWLSFSNISYYIETPAGEKRLLDDISAFAEPGSMTALMGASGAGKTTLLNVLAKRTSGRLDGNILLNGIPTGKVAYVEQFDNLYATETVRESLLFAAKLRLPKGIPDDIIEKIVDEVLDVLELTPLANSLIGNAIIPGLSPAQLKRVSIGVELVANKSVLFLDEPTTGLDSKSAQTVMRVARRIAQAGRTVVCTIHQPSAELFYMFDRLLLLGPGGKLVFFGSLGRRAVDLIKFFQNVPKVNPLPIRHNPATWMLEEIGTDGSMLKAIQSVYMESRRHSKHMLRLRSIERMAGENNVPHIVNNTNEKQVEEQDADIHSPEYSESAFPMAVLPPSSEIMDEWPTEGLFTQWIALQARSLRGYWRNPPSIFTRMAVTLINSLIFGCVYFNLTVTNQTAIVSSIASKSTAIIFGGVTQGGSLTPFIFNIRPVFYRERMSKMYNPILWTLVNSASELVCNIFAAFMIQIPVYFMSGALSEAQYFFKFYLITYTLCMSFSSMAILLSAAAPISAIAGLFQGLYFSIFVAFMGVGIPAHQIPAGWKWLFRIVPTSHATESLVMPQFENNYRLISTGGNRLITVRDYISNYLGFGYTGYWSNWGYMVLFIVVVQILAFLVSYRFVHMKK